MGRLGDKPAVAVFVGSEDETTRGGDTAGAKCLLAPWDEDEGKKEGGGEDALRWTLERASLQSHDAGVIHQLDHMMATKSLKQEGHRIHVFTLLRGDPPNLSVGRLSPSWQRLCFVGSIDFIILLRSRQRPVQLP